MTEPVARGQKNLESFYSQAALKSMEPLLAENLTFKGPFRRSSSAKARF